MGPAAAATPIPISLFAFEMMHPLGGGKPHSLTSPLPPRPPPPSSRVCPPLTRAPGVRGTRDASPLPSRLFFGAERDAALPRWCQGGKRPGAFATAGPQERSGTAAMVRFPGEGSPRIG